MARAFRFGGGLFWASSHAEWADEARRLESLGYDTLLMADHFSSGSFAPVPALVAAALATTRLRVGCTVFDNDFRHPAALAKETATVDVLCGGRFEFGLGAGWYKPEYDQVGIPFDAPPVRVSRLEEAIHIIKCLWADGPLSFHGSHYRISDYEGQPKPLQHPHPPIFIGGGGRRLLSLAAREADIVGILARAKPGGGLDSAEDTDASVVQKIGWVREAADDRFDQLELALLIQSVVITDDRRSGAEALAAGRPRPAEHFLGSPYHLIGSVDEIVDTLLQQRERYGISYYSVFPEDTRAFAPVVARLAGK